MEKIDILLWAFAIGFTFNFSLMLVMWGSLNSRIDAVAKDSKSNSDSVSKDSKSAFSSLENKLEKLDEKVTDIDRRICRLEGAFASKDCCMIKDDRQLRKVEGD